MLRTAVVAGRSRWFLNGTRQISSFSRVTEADLSHFRSILAEADVITDEETLKPFNTDWMNKYSGNSSLVLRPRSTAQVSQILAHCNHRLLPVVPQTRCSQQKSMKSF